jgi:hypothetical protein
VANKRVFYAIYKAGIAPLGSTNYETIHGLQNMGVTTTFNLEQVFEISQINIYENIEGIPDVEVTLEKVLDGWPPVLTLATQGAAAATLVGRSTQSCILAVATYPDTRESAFGSKVSEVHMSGMFISSFGYEITVDTNATETVTLVGNNKVWVGVAGEAAGTFDDGTHWDGTSSISGNDDRPYSIEMSGGVNRREDVLFGAGETTLPAEIPGINSSGWNILTGGEYGCHVQRIAINTDLGREDLFELGRKGTYHKYVSFPVEVTTEIGIFSQSGDTVSATEEGIFTTGGKCGRYNLTDHTVTLKMCEGLVVDCGNTNRLSTVGVTGGDTGGANQEITYTYTNFNECTVTHPRDPSSL